MNDITTFLLTLFCSFFMVQSMNGQNLKRYDQPGVLNPILPGYFADPTIKKIEDTYYIYATTDGNGWGAGPSQVWTSNDFSHWTIQPMNWPNTHWYWAPDMTQGYDDRYYLYYSQPVEIFGAVSDHPTGPWESLAPDNGAIIPNYLIPGVITLDAQTFTDDDGRVYMFWGTWGIYPDHGCAVGLLNKDMKSFEKVELIPNTVAKDFFEAPFMFKRDEVYYMMYSSGHCEDHTYRVQYVKSTVGPMGPFEYPEHNPILVTNEDGTIHGPGHHSVLEEDGRYYIMYHRHNNPHSGGGFHRQIAIDELLFTPEGDIENVIPTHTGVSALLKPNNLPEDIAFGKHVEVSSYYNEDFRPSFLVDNNNGTLWRAKENSQSAWFCIDLEKSQDIATVELRFEYPTYAYQYLIETSEDGVLWTTFVDQSKNDRWASPVLEHGRGSARYVRVHILNTQIPGLPRGLWGVKVYGDRLDQETIWSDPQSMPSQIEQVGKLIHIDALDYREGQRVAHIQNKGLLKGDLMGKEPVIVKNHQGKKAFYFDGTVSLRSTVVVPELMGGNSPYTVSMWVNNPLIERFENLIAWSKGSQDLTRAIVGYGKDPQRGVVTHGGWSDLAYSSVPVEDEWHHIVVSFDGYMERIYVNGKLQREENRMLFIRPADYFVVGASDILDHPFSGYLADLKVYNEALSFASIQGQMESLLLEDKFFAIESNGLELGEIHVVRNHGVVESCEILLERAEVLVAGGRTAIHVADIYDSTLMVMIREGVYTLDFDWFDGQEWQHGLVVRQKGRMLYFHNGKMDSQIQWNDVISFEGERIIFNHVFHSFRAYPIAMNAQEAAESFAIWQEKNNGGLDDYMPSFNRKPYYINDEQVFVQVNEHRSGLLYAFSSGDLSSGWVSTPYYLFDGTTIGHAVNVIIKDEFGNVGQLLTAHILDKKPDLIPKSEQLSYIFPHGSIPFWDGYQVGIYPDSTQVAITLDKGEWTIRSIHSKWGDTNLLAPYIYKEMDGDFTIEVKVKDVVGLQSKTRSSSESGIMIQSFDDEGLYINNTVLTGWNLGNLSRSIGDRIRQEGNTGKGLEFAPYLQVQKTGRYFFLRSSYDGQKWTDLPGTPFVRADLDGVKLRVGLYQVAGNNQEGYGVFEGVRLYKHLRQ